ncbi:MAG: 23S rRNA pseudouridine(2604) synthase RluF [Lachnospiraceae bacterium]|jgi:23S rRNA pseudouridine2604 synthase
MESIRLNKYLSEAGVCSRREADRLAEQGKILVDGLPAQVGMKVLPSQHITVNGKTVKAVEEQVLLAVNKPRGIECTAEPKVKKNIVKFVNYPVRIYPVGRLDKDSQGLILMTNQGDLVNKMMRAGNYHEKEYIVTVDKPLTREFIQRMSQGVPVLDTVTRKCKVWQTGKKSFHIILTQGLNRQIRRMCEYLGYEVKTLKRIRIMNIQLGDLQEGQYRKVTEEEWRKLQELIAHSSNTTVYQ